MHAALAVLLGLNGLRVGEACGANIENLGFERSHRTLQIIGKGNKPAGIPLVPRTARTLDLAIGERTHGPILIRTDGRRLDTRTAHRWVRSIGNRAGLDDIHPPHAASRVHHGRPRRRCPAARRPSRRPPFRSAHHTVYDRRRQNYDRHAAYAVVAFVTSG
jgi:integrase